MWILRGEKLLECSFTCQDAFVAACVGVIYWCRATYWTNVHPPLSIGAVFRGVSASLLCLLIKKTPLSLFLSLSLSLSLSPNCHWDHLHTADLHLTTHLPRQRTRYYFFPLPVSALERSIVASVVSFTLEEMFLSHFQRPVLPLHAIQDDH